MKKISKEVKIGIAFIIAIFILYYGINFLKGINKFRPANSFVVVFENVEGLTQSTPVTLNGFQVGIVAAMKLDSNNPEHILTYINMDKGLEVTKGSKIALDVSALGSAQLMLELNPYNEEYLSQNDTIVGTRNKGLMDAAAGLAPQLGQIIPKIDSIMTGLQTLVNSPALEQSLNNITSITNDLAYSTKQLNTMTNSMQKDLPKITGNFNQISQDIAGLSGQLKAIDLNSTYKSVDNMMKNLEQLSVQISSEDSSLGLLINDRQLYDSLNITISNASALLKDMKEHPERYINIKVF